MFTSELAIVTSIQSFFIDYEAVPVIVFLARWLILIMAFALASLAIFGDQILRVLARQALWSVLFALLFSLFFGEVFERIRPFTASLDVFLVIPAPASLHSFPSSHASAAFAIAFTFFRGRRSYAIVATLLALLVALGRVAAGVHYPTDIMGGMMVGVIGSYIAASLYRNVGDYEERMERKKKRLNV